MMNALSPEEVYRKQLETFNALLSQLQQKRRSLGLLRLAVFVATIAIAYYVFTRYGLMGLIPTTLGISVLLFLVSVDVANNSRIKNTQTLIQINEEELAILSHQYLNRHDGQEFSPAEHVYANDLDIFGKASIYQWMNRCFTEQGKKQLADNLLQPLSKEQALLRQEAIKEISTMVDWRQQWQAFSMQTTVTKKTENKIERWLKEEEEQFVQPGWKIFVQVYSFITLASAVAAIIDIIPGAVFSMLFLFYLVTSLVFSRKAIKLYYHLDGIVKETATLQSMVDWLEQLNPSSPYLQQLQATVKTTTHSAGKELRDLKAILDRFDLRSSIIGLLFFNPFLLWDVRQIISLNNWRKRNANNVTIWFEAVAEMEVLHTIATLHLNQPAWCFPHFASSHFTFNAEQVGHPLLPQQQRVNNSFQLAGTPKIGLITGSNMAGKSTFLRSLGVNVVLAQMGAPVCAKTFVLSPVQLVSSMRIADNLAENTSTFYAELKKLRTIIEMVKAHLPVFILLDEILRGTNSFDRHKGSAALIRQLIKENAVAVIATHDVELAQLQTEYLSSIENYHFDVEVEGEELYFDYKLKSGVCRSLNASILMKKIGIDL